MHLKISVALFFAIVLVLSSAVEIKLLKDDERITFVSGTVAEYLPDPIFYDTYVPLIYEFGIPQHMDSAVKINWDHANVCNSSDSRYDGKLCPVVHHLHKIVTNLTIDMGFWKEYYTTDADKRPAVDKSANSVICDEIIQHFDNHFTSREHLDKYITNLKSCHFGEFLQQNSFSSKWVIDKSIYYTMMERFYQEFYRSLPSTGLVDWAITLNSYTALQGILLTNNYIESNEIMHAMTQCQSGFLPEIFVKKSMLQKSLQSLYEKINSVHYEYVFDKDLDLSPYYKYELADCTFTDNYTMIVRVLVPLKTDVASKLLQITTYPFIQNGNSSEHVKLCTLKVPGKMNMIESDSGLLFETQCHQPNELCKVTELSSFYQTDGCVAAVLSNSEEQILRNCQLNCFSVDPLATLPMFRKIESDKFVVIGTSKNKIFITCNNQPVEMLNLRDEGSLELQLACNCRIAYRKQVFRPTIPCGNKLVVSHIMPYHWETGRTTTTHVPYSILDNTIDTESHTKPNIADHFNETVIEKQIYTEMIENGYPVSKGFITQICLLWILVVTLLACCSILIYQVYFLVKWKEMQIYKDTRIVYNVPDSPKIANKY